MAEREVLHPIIRPGKDRHFLEKVNQQLGAKTGHPFHVKVEYHQQQGQRPKLVQDSLEKYLDRKYLENAILPSSWCLHQLEV